MPTVLLSTIIHAPIERCFDLARSIDLHSISTAQTGERAIAGRTSGLIGLGETVTWSAVHFGIRQELQSEITAYEYPVFFVDEMLRGAFKSIYHEHHFKSTGNDTLMTDKFNFESPMGILGQMANALFLTSYMRRLLTKRNVAIKYFAESEEWRKVLPDHL
ncbi:MAG: cell division protein [Bacteroidetes bacterium]|nr:cell division protein [Bacteroidota bacterium]